MGKPVEKKRKKKGRPSLLDLQKRSLRLQKQQQQQQQQNKKSSNPIPNPYVRFPRDPNSTPGRRSTRRSTEPEPDVEDGEDDEDGSGKRREKKLKLVLRLHQNEDGSNRSGNLQRNLSAADSSGSESKGEGGIPRKKRNIDAVSGDGSGREKTERQNSASKATEGELSHSGPVTPLPDKKLLVFILDRLQKKDTYGVFSEPVNPIQLPDYHEIIEHPMDFGTVRKRLSSGYYKNLEMFEKDVFLICSNAMSYNAPDTIYFRQARSIQELAMKSFENLRQDSDDDDEPEPKIVRRGRPPGKSTTKRPVGRPPSERTSSDFSSDATLANAGDNMIWSNSYYDLSRKGFASDRSGSIDAFARANHSSLWIAEKSDRNEETASGKGIPIKFGKKVTVLDENRRNTYKQSQPSTCWHESSILTTFDGEKKQLVLVGLHTEHAYARSLARFSANLGPVGWEIAAKQIEKVLPPGTKFGRGWVGEPDAPQQYRPPLLSTSPPRPWSELRISDSSVLSKGDATLEQSKMTSNNLAVEEGHLSQTITSACSPAIPRRPSNTMEAAKMARGLNYGGSFGLHDSGSSSGGGDVSIVPSRPSNPVESAEATRGLSHGGGRSSSDTAGMQPKAPFHLHQNMTSHPVVNGFNTAFRFDMSQAGKMISPPRPTGNFVPDMPMTHARALEMVSRGNSSFGHPASAPHLGSERTKPGSSGAMSSVKPMQDYPIQDPGSAWRGLSLHPRPESTQPPDLNVRFQSPGSPPSGVVVDLQQPDLALQL